MPTVGWDEFRERLRKRARFIVGEVVTVNGKRCRISGRYWRQQTGTILYDAQEISADGAGYVRTLHKVPEERMKRLQ
jgi:hypothetical protein